jgi:hypothetical protein
LRFFLLSCTRFPKREQSFGRCAAIDFYLDGDPARYFGVRRKNVWPVTNLVASESK